MSNPISFGKVIETGHRKIEVFGLARWDGLTVRSLDGDDDEIERVDLHSFEAVRDLHYALGRYIELREKQQ